MIKNIIYISLALLVFSTTHAKTESGVDFPDSLNIFENTLQLNGTGTRKKLFIKLYAAGLYLDAASSNASEILASDKPMALSLTITSGFIDSKKMEKAVIDGFNNATNGNTDTIQEKIDMFLAVLREEIVKKDQFRFDYQPGTGTHVIKNGQEKAVIEGLDFKSALFGIWLSYKPAQENLKQGLLGK